MKKALAFMLAGLLLLACEAHAIDFQIKGKWNIGFGVADPYFTKNHKDNRGVSHKTNTQDTFAARQRLFLQLDAVASEDLSGTVQLFTGPQKWGYAAQGGALGADGTVMRLRQAYIDFKIPDTTITTRMGVQNFAMPYAAGGSAVFDLRGTAVNAHMDITENVGLTAIWFRPFNDNYNPDIPGFRDGNDPAGYLDNMDLFAISVPINFDGLSVNPWVMYGMQGRNTGRFPDYRYNGLADGDPAITMTPYLNAQADGGGLNVVRYGQTSKTYGSLFWAGLPIKLTMLEPWNIEFDFNYGFVEEMGRFDVMVRNNPNEIRHGSTQRQGWLAKALVEYAFDWGVPGIFGWYGSGDDGNVKNGSERMPSVCPYVFMTSFMGDGNLGWGPAGDYLDLNVSMSGTWGVGFQLRDISFIEDITHTFRVAWWGGTNSPAMVKYMNNAYAWESTSNHFDGPYMTVNDGLLEFNLVNVYKVYENFDINLELGYIANYMDGDTWKKDYRDWGGYTKQDAWKAQVIFTYQF